MFTKIQVFSLLAVISVSGLMLNLSNSFAGTPNIISAYAQKRANNTYNFTVVVRHDDDKRKHWVNRWDVLTPNRTLIKSRVFLHGHPHEQPFTRHLKKVSVPTGAAFVYIRAHDLVHGFGPMVKVNLPTTGPNSVFDWLRLNLDL